MHWLPRRTAAAWALLVVAGLLAPTVSSSSQSSASTPISNESAISQGTTSDSKTARLDHISYDYFVKLDKEKALKFIETEQSHAKTTTPELKKRLIQKYNLDDLFDSQKALVDSTPFAGALGRFGRKRSKSVKGQTSSVNSGQVSSISASEYSYVASDALDVNCGNVDNHMYIAWELGDDATEPRPILVRGRYWGVEPDLDAVADLQTRLHGLPFITVLNTKKPFERNTLKILQTLTPGLLYQWNDDHYNRCMALSWASTDYGQSNGWWSTKLKHLVRKKA